MVDCSVLRCSHCSQPSWLWRLIVIKTLLIALTLTMSGCMINPLAMLDTIKVIVDKTTGKVLNVVHTPSVK